MACSPDGRFFAHGGGLLPVLRWAFDVHEFQLPSVPPPVGRLRFDLDARASGPVSQDECRQMVQALFADRFKMKIHCETKEVPVYALVVGPGGPTMTKVTESMKDPGAGITVNDKPIPYPPPEGWSMERLAAYLGGPLTAPDRPVVDRTGLSGFYAVKLDIVISPENSTTLAMAARRLGLNAEARSEPFETIVIDHTEMPDAN